MMFEERRQIQEGILLFADVVCIGLAFLMAYYLRNLHESLPLLSRVWSTPWEPGQATRSDYLLLLLLNAAIWVLTAKRARVYEELPRLPRAIRVYIRALTLNLLATGLLVFAAKIFISRLFFGYFYASILALCIAKQTAANRLLRGVRAREAYRSRALIIGPRDPAVAFAELVKRQSSDDYSAIRVMATDGGDASEPGNGAIRQPLSSDSVLATEDFDEVFVVGSGREIAALADVVETLVQRGKVVCLVTGFRVGQMVPGRVTHFAGIPVLAFGPMPKDEIRGRLRRVMDMTVSLLALIVFAPLMALIAVAIKLTDGGPVFFTQARLGQGGREFPLYKFRSMRVNAEEILRSNAELYRKYVDNDFKLPEKEDPRVTAIGRFLRKTSLDELPQLWNVLRGDMALVGPRPIVPKELQAFRPYEELLLSVPPGLTGQWQVSGRSEVKYPERAYLELEYIAHACLGKDFAIVARTVPAILRRRGAH